MPDNRKIIFPVLQKKILLPPAWWLSFVSVFVNIFLKPDYWPFPQYQH